MDDEDVIIADLFTQSQQSCAMQQQQQRLHQPVQPQLQRPPPPPPRVQPTRSQPVSDTIVEQPLSRSSPRVSERAASASVDALFCSIPGPIRRLWLQSQHSSQVRRSKRRRPNAATVDLTSDERLDEWQRAADSLSARQPSWRTMIAQHCSLEALIDSQLADSPLSANCSAVRCLLVRVDTLVSSSHCPSMLSSRQLHLVGDAKRQLHDAGVLRDRLSGRQAQTESTAAVVAAASASSLSAYHSACLSDARCTVSADVHDSLCRAVSGSSIGGVLSVGCYVLLSDVAALYGRDGRPPHLVVQRHNVCAVQQPPAMEGDDAALDSTQHDDEADRATATQQSVLLVPAPDPSAVAAAAVNNERSVHAAVHDYPSLDELDMGDD